MFLGTHTPRLDDKGRLALPAKFRPGLEGGLVICKGQEHCDPESDGVGLALDHLLDVRGDPLAVRADGREVHRQRLAAGPTLLTDGTVITDDAVGSLLEMVHGCPS